MLTWQPVKNLVSTPGLDQSPEHGPSLPMKTTIDRSLQFFPDRRRRPRSIGRHSRGHRAESGQRDGLEIPRRRDRTGPGWSSSASMTRVEVG